MSEYFEYTESERSRDAKIYDDYVNGQKSHSVIDWMLVASLVGTLGIAAFFLWVSRW